MKPNVINSETHIQSYRNFRSALMKNNTPSSCSLPSPTSFGAMASFWLKGTQHAVLAGLISLPLLTAATAADFSGSLKGVTITDAQATNKAPIASFTYSISGNTVNLDASSSSDPDGSITNYQWDLGNGTKASGVTAVAEYPPGTYPVTLTVQDNANGIAMSQQIINYANLCQTGIKVVGTNNSASTWTTSRNSIKWSREQATTSCTITHLSLRVKDTNGPGIKARFAIFTDANGEPETQLGVTSEILTTQADGSPETLHAQLTKNVTLEQGKWYWLGVVTSSDLGATYRTTKATTECGYQDWAYASTGDFPSPARKTDAICRDVYGSAE